MSNLKEAIKSAKTLNLNNYKFKTFSFGERGGRMEYELLNEITKKLSRSIKSNFKNFDYILSPEPGGHLWGSLVSFDLKKDINILRLNPSNQEKEIKVTRKTAYNNNQLFFSKFKKGDRVVIIDDIISSGSTLKSIIKMLNAQKLVVVGVQVILVRTNKYQEIEKKYNVPVKFLEQEELDFDYASGYPSKNAPWTFYDIPVELKNLLLEKDILKKGKTVLEIGCGEGIHSIFLAKNGLKVTGIDISKTAIDIARKNAKKNKTKLKFLNKSYLELDKINEKFDFIFDWRFLMVPTNESDRDNYLKDVFNHVKKNGHYLSVAFSGDSEFMGKGKIRTSPIGARIYFEKLNDSIKRFKKYFKIIESKHIIVPQKPNMNIKANYILAKKITD